VVAATREKAEASSLSLEVAVGIAVSLGWRAIGLRAGENTVLRAKSSWGSHPSLYDVAAFAAGRGGRIGRPIPAGELGCRWSGPTDPEVSSSMPSASPSLWKTMFVRIEVSRIRSSLT
jgi:hypothetical protein